MKKLISLLLFIAIGFATVGSYVNAEDNIYKYLNKSIIEKLDKKIDSIKGNKTKSLILLINKVDKIIKIEKNETKKALYTELNIYLKLKKKEIEKLKVNISDNINNLNYVDKELGLSFSYSKNFGNLEKQYEYGDEGLANLQLLINNELVFGLANGKPVPGRGAYWGDEAFLIDSQEYINNLCINSKIDKTKNENCEILKNINGIIYVKKTVNWCGPDEDCNNLVDFYYFYNPYSAFRGIVISNERLNADIDDFNNIIDSLYFINTGK